MKLLAQNKKAHFEYFILSTLEVGIVLHGAEVKSIRAGHVSIAESFVQIDGGELVLKNAQINTFKQNTQLVIEEKRNRKLLASKEQIIKLKKQIEAKGLTIVPTKLYLNSKGLVKLEIAVCRGKHTYDKKNVIKERDIKRETEKQIKKAIR